MKPITTGTVLVTPPLAIAGVLGFTDVLEDGERIGSLLEKSRNSRKLITDSDENWGSWNSVAVSFLDTHREEIKDIYFGKSNIRDRFNSHKQYCENVFWRKTVDEKSPEFLKALDLCTRSSS